MRITTILSITLLYGILVQFSYVASIPTKSIKNAPVRCFDCNYSPTGMIKSNNGSWVHSNSGFHKCGLEQETDHLLINKWECKSGRCFIRQDDNGLVYRGCGDDWNVPHSVDTSKNCAVQGSKNTVWWFCNGDLCNDKDITTACKDIGTEYGAAHEEYTEEDQGKSWRDNTSTDHNAGYSEIESEEGPYPVPKYTESESSQESSSHNTQSNAAYGNNHWNPWTWWYYYPFYQSQGHYYSPQRPAKSHQTASSKTRKSTEPQKSHVSYKSHSPQPSYKSHEPQKSHQSQPSYKSHQSQPAYKSHDLPQPSYKSHQPQPSYKSHEPRKSQPSYKSHQPQPSYKSHEPRKSQPSYKSHQPQPTYKSHEPRKSQPSYKSHQPQPTYKSHDPEPSYQTYKTHEPQKSHETYQPEKSHESYQPEKSHEPQKSHEPASYATPKSQVIYTVYQPEKPKVAYYPTAEESEGSYYEHESYERYEEEPKKDTVDTDTYEIKFIDKPTPSPPAHPDGYNYYSRRDYVRTGPEVRRDYVKEQTDRFEPEKEGTDMSIEIATGNTVQDDSGYGGETYYYYDTSTDGGYGSDDENEVAYSYHEKGPYKEYGANTISSYDDLCTGECIPGGLFSFPGDRTRFVQCGGGMRKGGACQCCKANIHHCPRGTSFDDSIKNCSQGGDSSYEERHYKSIDM